MSYRKSDAPYAERADGAGRIRRHRRTGENADNKRRWLFLSVDILLLVAILAAIFFLVVLLTPFDPFGGAKKEDRMVEYAVEFAGVKRDEVQALQMGQEVIDATTGSVVGEIVNIESRAYEVYTTVPSKVTQQEGEHALYLVTKNTYPEEYQTVTVTIRVLAEYEEGVGYYVEDCRIAVGRTYELRFPTFAGEGGVCVTFTEK